MDADKINHLSFSLVYNAVRFVAAEGECLQHQQGLS
jgi:hypothetical protein